MFRAGTPPRRMPAAQDAAAWTKNKTIATFVEPRIAERRELWLVADPMLSFVVQWLWQQKDSPCCWFGRLLLKKSGDPTRCEDGDAAIDLLLLSSTFLSGSDSHFVMSVPI